MRIFAVLVLCTLAAFAGHAFAEGATEVVTRVDSVYVEPADYEVTKDGLAIATGEITGLRARIRGLESRQPRTIYLTDSVLVSDTVFVVVKDGRLTYQLATSLAVPAPVELHADIDISDCDDGWQIRDREVVCDEAQLGHLYVGPWLSRRPSLAVWWEPSFRSPWEASVSFDGSRWDFGLRRGIRLW